LWFWVLGLGFGVWGPPPNPQTPNPQSPIPNSPLNSYQKKKFNLIQKSNDLIITNNINDNNPIKSIKNRKISMKNFHNLDGSIPEEIEINKKSIHRTSKKIDRYFIDYIKNIYENESHLNNNILKTPQKNVNNLKNKFIPNRNIDKMKCRRKSAINNELFLSQFNNNINNKMNNNIGIEKKTINSYKNYEPSFLRKITDEEIDIVSLFNKKNLTKNEDEILQYYLNIIKRKESSPKTQKRKHIDSLEKSPKSQRKHKKKKIPNSPTKNKEKSKSIENEKIEDAETKNINDNIKNDKESNKNIKKFKWFKSFLCCLKMN